jgi:hypothetical protein
MDPKRRACASHIQNAAALTKIGIEKNGVTDISRNFGTRAGDEHASTEFFRR